MPISPQVIIDINLTPKYAPGSTNINGAPQQILTYLSSYLRGLQGPQGETGPEGASVNFQIFEFNPLSGSVSAVFTPDQASTIVTDTTIGSANDNTSPNLFVGFNANVESMSAVNVTDGSLTLDILTNNSFQIIIFHDGIQNPIDLLTAAFSGGLLYPHAGAMVAITGGGSSTPIFLLRGDPTANTSQNVASSGSSTTLTLSDTAISIESASCSIDTTVFNHLSVFVTQNLSMGFPAPVDTFNYASTLQSSTATPIPDMAQDGNMLHIVRHAGTVLGNPVKIGDVAVLANNKSSALIFPNVLAAAAVAQAEAQNYADEQDIINLRNAENYSDVNSTNVLQAAREHTDSLVGETSIADRQYTRDQIAVSVSGFTYTQSTASSSWYINHNLARYPVVTIVDTAGTQLYADTTYVDANNVRIDFGTPISGVAYLM